ncbi:A disintegrin and metalloproteinase with thrombospondin motifs 20-like isoform X2 [Rhinatrema bivittatum]|uniref:A disintegrin and metalloproteinase with thrombospondin motifs 20-like isoform X2 n=1 Tax=Rhinatrema bivittatum TaxID=194408 RepID=UPI00112CD3CA|nr:A disintegrin and metalloproteinase with thrombospondin motifs 20-like isoform X2 [Rhinatrema bivittatum]
MRGLPCLAWLLWQLFVLLLLSGAREVRFHPKQEALVRRLASYEIVFPARVTELGEPFPASQHYRRRKRSPEEPAQPRTHFRLRAYGQRFQLSLSADAGFIAASYSALHRGAAGAGHRQSPELQHCFYSGHVNARPAHTAVVSLCGGLHVYQSVSYGFRPVHTYAGSGSSQASTAEAKKTARKLCDNARGRQKE